MRGYGVAASRGPSRFPSRVFRSDALTDDRYGRQTCREHDDQYWERHGQLCRDHSTVAAHTLGGHNVCSADWIIAVRADCTTPLCTTL